MSQLTVESNANPFYLASEAGQVFAMFEPASAAVPQRSAVLVCAPWGWEETASYRVRRAWAQTLAAAGHPTLRLDLPGTGNSAGGAGDSERVKAWSAAIGGAVAWLRRESGSADVAVLGIGIGGLLALDAIERGAPVDEIVLWGTPARGRKFVREAQAFAKMQAGGAGRGEETALPEGWLEVAGFVLSPETITELGALRAQVSPTTRLRRALVLNRDGLPADAAITDSLREAGVEVSTGEGDGWGQMVVHPEEALLPDAVVAAVAEWLDAAPAAAVGADAAAGAAPQSVGSLSHEAGVREEPITLPGPAGELFGVLAEPADGRRADLCAVFLNAGAIRHIGPSRLWVDNSRRWAARGVPCVRVDLDGIGESGDGGLSSDGIGRHYGGTYLEQVQAILDVLQDRGFGNRFVLVGLCSGAYWSMQATIADDRVKGAVMLNAGALVWRPNLQHERRFLLLGNSLRHKSSWMKLLRGEVKILEKLRVLPAMLAKYAGDALRKVGRRIGPRAKAPSRQSQTRELLDRVEARKVPVIMAFCSNEYVLLELQGEGLGELSEWPNIELRILGGEDHALGPIVAQASAREAIDLEFQRLLGTAEQAQGSGAGTLAIGAEAVQAGEQR
jgi:pimeloyl-ACP methyl ester carboxylesterase